MSESSLPSMSPCTQTLSPGGPWRPITQGNGSLVCPMPRSPPTCSSTCGAEGEVTHHTEDGSTGKSSNIISCKIKINLGLETNQTTQQNIVNLSMFVSRNKLMEAQSKARSQRGYWQEWNKNSQKQTKNIHQFYPSNLWSSLVKKKIKSMFESHKNKVCTLCFRYSMDVV